MSSEHRIKNEERGKKLERRKSAMRVNGRGLKTVILPVLAKKAQEPKK